MRTMLPPVTVELRERAPLEGPGHGFTTRRCGTRTAVQGLIDMLVDAIEERSNEQDLTT